ncbi:Major Facilitator Superfamily protein [Candidatus Anstonella stagnisolia]|nr:Major Facilitator Superfamily protein [Candidatus Anstonella stagnisolia]
MERNIPIAQTLMFSKTFVSNATRFYLPLFFVSMGLAGWQNGVLLSIASLCALLFSFFSGYISDTFSTKKAISAGILLLFLFNIGMLFAQGFFTVLPLMLFAGFGSTLLLICADAYILKIKTKKEGEKFGKSSFSNFMGSATGLFVLGALLFFFNFHAIFAFNALVLCVVYLRSRSLDEIKVSEQHPHHYMRDFSNRPMLLISIVLFLMALHWGAEATSYALFLKTNLGLDALGSGLYMSIPIVILAFAAFLTGKQVDKPKFNVTHWLFLGMLLSGLFHILMTVPILPFSFAMRIFHEIGDAIIDVIVYVGLSKVLPSKRLAGGFGLLISIMLFGEFAGTLIFGYLGGIYGYAFPLAASGAITLLSLCIAYYYRHLIFKESAVAAT